ncbi:hypothetical protein KW784_01860 [Candidatus Parcubacteria bacterium]|nr:hypothetical protein [Candidatus Parcubacteria bacterium]
MKFKRVKELAQRLAASRAGQWVVTKVTKKATTSAIARLTPAAQPAPVPAKSWFAFLAGVYVKVLVICVAFASAAFALSMIIPKMRKWNISIPPPSSKIAIVAVAIGALLALLVIIPTRVRYYRQQRQMQGAASPAPVVAPVTTPVPAPSGTTAPKSWLHGVIIGAIVLVVLAILLFTGLVGRWLTVLFIVFAVFGFSSYYKDRKQQVAATVILLTGIFVILLLLANWPTPAGNASGTVQAASGDRTGKVITITHQWSEMQSVAPGNQVIISPRQGNNVAYQVKTWYRDRAPVLHTYERTASIARDWCSDYIQIEERFSSFQIRIIDKEIEQADFDLVTQTYQSGGPCGKQKSEAALVSVPDLPLKPFDSSRLPGTVVKIDVMRMD